MTRVVAGIVLGLALMGSLHAEEGLPAAAAATPPSLEVPPERLGYAFDRPEILLRQRLFGLAHGIALLLAGCRDDPAYTASVTDAYAAWHARQSPALARLVHDLADYYFGLRAPEAEWNHLVKALNLGDSIQPALGELSLQDACASLPQALAGPRYEFDTLLTEPVAPEAAVPPAPTFESRQ